MRPVVHDYAAHIFLVDLSLLYLLLSRVVSLLNTMYLCLSTLEAGRKRLLNNWSGTEIFGQVLSLLSL